MSRLLAGTAAFVLFVPALRADPFTAHFADLSAELSARALELAEPADKSEKAQLKAVLKSLAAIGKDSSSLLTDLKTAGKVAKKLAKAFPEELPPPPGETLDGLLDALLDALEGDVSAAVDAAVAAAAALPEVACATKVDAKATLASDLLAAAALLEVHADRAAALRKALKAAGKADKAATKCAGGGGGGGNDCDATNVIDVLVDSVAFPFASAGCYRGTDVESLVVNARNDAPDFDELNLVAWGVDGIGPFPIQEDSTFTPNGDGTFGPFSTYTVTGTITLSKFEFTDNENNSDDCFAGTIDVTFSNGEVTVEIEGSFDISQPIGF